MRTLKRSFFVCIGLFLLSACTKSEQNDNKIVLRVDQNEFSAKDFAESLSQQLKWAHPLALKNEDYLKNTKDQILQNFLHSYIAEKWLAAQNKSVKDSEVEAEIKKVRDGYPDDLQFRESLAQQGLSYSEWSEAVKTRVAQKKVLDLLRAQINPPGPEEIKSYYQEHQSDFRQKAKIRLRQIVLSKEDEAERILQSLKTANFEELAKKFSIAPEGKEGGVVGWVERGQFEAFDAVFSAPVGKRSPIIKSSFGFHIIEVLERRPETLLSLEQAKEQIVRLLIETREQAAYAAWLEGQLKNTKIYKNEDLIRSIVIDVKEE